MQWISYYRANSWFRFKFSLISKLRATISFIIAAFGAAEITHLSVGFNPVRRPKVRSTWPRPVRAIRVRFVIFSGLSVHNKMFFKTNYRIERSETDIALKHVVPVHTGVRTLNEWPADDSRVVTVSGVFRYSDQTRFPVLATVSGSRFRNEPLVDGLVQSPKPAKPSSLRPNTVVCSPTHRFASVPLRDFRLENYFTPRPRKPD